MDQTSLTLLDSLPNTGLEGMLDGLGPEQIKAVVTFSSIMGYFSLIGILFNLITTLLLKNSTKLMQNMIIGLSIMDLINASVVPFLPLPVYKDWICQFESFLLYFGYGGSLAMTCCIAHSLYVTVKQDYMNTLQGMFTKYLSRSIIAASFTATCSVLTRYKQLNPNTYLCSHTPRPGQFELDSFLVLLLPSILSLSYCIFCYSVVLKKLRETNQKIFGVLLFYPLILVITNLPITVSRIISQLDSNFQQPFILSLISNILIASRGLLNAFAYGLSRRIIEGYHKKCCQRRKQLTNTTVTLKDGQDRTGSIVEAGGASIISSKLLESSDYDTERSLHN